jgi:hypothetical protein
MAAPFNIGQYTVDLTELPPILWRVTHSSSSNDRDSETGEILAKDHDCVILDRGKLKRAAANHLRWHSREASPFMSVFGDEKHAHNWANKLKEPISITPIITAILGLKSPNDVHIFRASHLYEEFELTFELDSPDKPSENEFMFLHRIPWQALGCMRRLDGTAINPRTNAMVNLVHEANDAFAAVIASTGELNDHCFGGDEAMIGAIDNFKREMHFYHLVRTRVMASSVIDHLRNGGGGNIVGSTIKDPFGTISRILTDYSNGKRPWYDNVEVPL